ncbi:putative aminoacyl-tRNA synthetase, class Ic, tetratricopeptide-like helical domain superfamily [Helianthus annuus]|nr:putative aminoacyl-tRNA synthetase, class Ic, tetratricopeptide-like helical domain superfamily [Helianthus annuus]
MTSLILPTASLSTPPQSPISSSSSRIQHTLTQRIHIPPHIYKHPAAILLELCTSLQELHQIIPLIIKNGLYQEHLFQTKLVSLFCKYNSLTEATRVFEPIEDKNDALYHTMLKGYAQNSSISDGFSFFCRMVEDGVQPVVYNFTYLLKGCGENNYVREGKEVHAHVILNGHEGDIYVMTCVVNMYAKCKLVEDAYKVFVRLPERDLVCWNTIIAGYAQNGFAGRAIELVAQMLSEGLRPDPVTVISILPAVGNVGDLRVGKSIHGYVFKSGYERHGNVATALVDMYLKCGCLSTGRVIFDKMSSKNVVSWNIMIDGYAQNDDYAEALSLFDKMLDNGFKPTGVTVMAALHACADSGELTRGLFVHSLVNELGLKHDVSVMNSLISMYCKCKRVDIAAEIFKNMKEKTLVSWNAMILGYAQNGQIISALNHFRIMKVKNIDPDSFTMVSIIAAVTEFSVLRQAKWVHGVVTRTCLDTNVFVKTALVDMYAKCGAITTARKLFDLMNDRHVTTWNAMIDGYGTHGYGTEAIKLFKKMEAGDIKPNNITFLCIISACSHSGFVEEGCQYFCKMKNEYEIEPTMDHYGAMVDLLGRSGRLTKAWDFIQNMPVEPGLNVFGAMLGACKIHKNVELAEMAADRLFELNPNDGGYYVLLANIYATASMWDKVTEIRSKMEERGIRKTPGYSSVELENEVHTFYSGSSWHSDSNKIYNFLEILIDKIKDAGYVPTTDLMQDVEDDLQEQMVSTHSEKVAIAFGLLNTRRGTTIHIRKNLRVCGDCHNATKYISLVENREIIVRDLHRFHHFKNGICSCGDYCYICSSDLVPVGEDQKQHLELTRELAERVNHLYGGRKWKKLGGRGGLIFKVPEPLIPPAGARVMSLTDGLSKMSKSATSDLSRINLLDSKDAIANKIKRCKTDSFPGLEFDNPDRPECNNLLSIYQIITNKTKEEVAQECQSMNWGTFKPVLTDALIDHLQPIQARYEEIMSDTGYLDQVLAEGASKAADIADVTVSNVYQAMGFLKRR